MHIALADSSPGDRKQMERLLSRESDKRKDTTGVFYIETYGSSASLLATPTVYDAYFLDVTDEGNNSLDIALRIREKGIVKPIVFCRSIDFLTGKELPANSFIIEKPIKVDDLSRLLDEVIEHNEKNRIPTIEFRNNKESYYLEERSIEYIKGEKYSVRIFMADGSEKTATGYIENVYSSVKGYDAFLPINNKTIVNMNHVTEFGFLSCFMESGIKLHIAFRYRKLVRSRLRKFKEN